MLYFYLNNAGNPFMVGRGIVIQVETVRLIIVGWIAIYKGSSRKLRYIIPKKLFGVSIPNIDGASFVDDSLHSSNQFIS